MLQSSVRALSKLNLFFESDCHLTDELQYIGKLYSLTTYKEVPEGT